MERLTKFELPLGIYDIKENIIETKCFEKLGKYEDLEEQIGCPLEVRCKIYDSQSVFNDDGEELIIQLVEEQYFSAYSTIDYDITYSLYYKDHKKTWWLKADRSE